MITIAFIAGFATGILFMIVLMVFCFIARQDEDTPEDYEARNPKVMA